MKKTLAIILITISLCGIIGCDDSYYTITYPEPVIVHPDNEAANTINGYRESQSNSSHILANSVASNNNSSNKSSGKSSSNSPSDTSSVANNNSSTSLSQQNENVTIIYLGNKNTKKLHTNTCRYVKDLDENKLEVFSEYDEAINSGFEPCKVCLKNNNV